MAVSPGRCPPGGCFSPLVGSRSRLEGAGLSSTFPSGACPSLSPACGRGGEAAFGRGGWDHLEFGPFPSPPGPRYLALGPLASLRSARRQASGGRAEVQRLARPAGTRAGAHGRSAEGGRARACVPAPSALPARAAPGTERGSTLPPSPQRGVAEGRCPRAAAPSPPVVLLPGPSLQTPHPIAVTPAAPPGGARAGHGEWKRLHGPGRRGRARAAEPLEPAARPAVPPPLSRAPGPTPHRRARLRGHGPPCGWLNLSLVFG